MNNGSLIDVSGCKKVPTVLEESKKNVPEIDHNAMLNSGL